jgi:hypothetical protein
VEPRFIVIASPRAGAVVLILVFFATAVSVVVVIVVVIRSPNRTRDWFADAILGHSKV